MTLPLTEQRKAGKAPATCHPDKPLYCRGKCRPCYTAWRERERPQLRERRLRYLKENRSKYEARRLVRARELYAGRDIAFRREAGLRSRYRLSLADYDRMALAQGGLCAICRRPPRGKTKGRRLYVDHDARTRTVRGLLCAGCNTALGQFLHDPAVFETAIAYLLRGSVAT